jgi:hypothetical protein
VTLFSRGARVTRPRIQSADTAQAAKVAPGLIAVLAMLPFVLLIAVTAQVAAQSAGRDSRDDGAAARTDAILATPGRTPAPQMKLFSTAPGPEQLARPTRPLEPSNDPPSGEPKGQATGAK